MKETFKLIDLEQNVREIQLNVIANDYIQALVNYFIATPLELASAPNLNIYLSGKYFLLNDILIKSTMQMNMGPYHIFTKRIPAIAQITPEHQKKIDLYPRFIIPHDEFTETLQLKNILSTLEDFTLDDHCIVMEARTR